MDTILDPQVASDWAIVSAFVVEYAQTAFYAVASVAVTQAVALFRRWLRRATVLGAVNTAAGRLMVQVAAGAIQLKDVSAGHPMVVGLATQSLENVPTAAKALGGVTPVSMAQMVVGAWGRAFLGDSWGVPAGEEAARLRPATPETATVVEKPNWG